MYENRPAAASGRTVSNLPISAFRKPPVGYRPRPGSSNWPPNLPRLWFGLVTLDVRARPRHRPLRRASPDLSSRYDSVEPRSFGNSWPSIQRRSGVSDIVFTLVSHGRFVTSLRSTPSLNDYSSFVNGNYRQLRRAFEDEYK